MAVSGREILTAGSMRTYRSLHGLASTVRMHTILVCMDVRFVQRGQGVCWETLGIKLLTRSVSCMGVSDRMRA